MPRQIAVLVFLLGIWGLFVLARDRRSRTAGALWLPVTWLALAASRSVAQWMAVFGLGGDVSSTTEQYVEGSPFDRNVYLALTVIAIIVLIKRQRKLVMLLRANLPILLFYFYCAVSIIWSDYPDV